MRKIYSLVLASLLLLAGNGILAQSTANYTFAPANTSGSLALDRNGNAIDMTTGTTLIVAADLDDNNGSNLISNIGFDFFFYGNRYTQFSATSNGIIGLGSTAIGTTTYAVSAGSTTTPRLSPFGSDLRTGTSGKVHFKVVGTAPNRCLVIEFSNMSILYVGTPGSNDGTFQARLYETSGIVEYVYGAMSRNSGTLASTSAVGIGFSVGTALNTTASVTSSSNTVAYTATFNTNTYTAGSGAITNLNSASNGSRRVYAFIPPGNTGNALTTTLAAPSGLNFTSVGPSSMTVNWTASSPATGVVKYAIYNSTDGGTTYNFVNTTAVGTNTLTVTGLTINTTYTWKVIAISEGASSSALTGSQATSGPQTYTWNVASGAWGTASNWSPARNVPDPTDVLQFNNSLVGATQTATGVPAQTIQRLIVGGGVNAVLQAGGANTLTITSDGTATNELSVASGSSLLINGASALTTTFTSGSTANIAGTLELNNTSGVNSLTLTNCVMTIATGGKLAAGGSVATNPFSSSTSSLLVTGTYEHKYTTVGGTVPTATWNTNSKVLISGYTSGTTAPSGFTQTFFDVEWSCSGQTGNINCSGSIPNVTGTFTMTSTGTGTFRLSGTSTYSATWANYSQTGGTLDLSTGASASAQTLTIGNNFNQTGGTFQCSGSGTTAPVLNFNKSTAGAANVNFFNAAPTGPIVYRISATSGISLTGSGTLTSAFNINATGGVRISTLASPAISTSLALTYATGTTLTYDYATGVFSYTASSTEFPSAGGPTNLVLNISSGSSVQVPFTRSLPSTGVLTLTSGILAVTSGNTFTVGNSAAAGISGGSSTAYVTGKLIRTFAASLTGATTYNYPVGTATAYSLIQALPTTTAGGTSSLQFEAFDGATGGTPDMSTLVSLNNDKYWTASIVSGTNFTNTVLKLTDATYGTQARMAQSATLTGTYGAVSAGPASNVLTSSALTSPGFITVGQFGTLLSGTKTVCASGCDYSSLTLAGGAFASINAAILNGNLTLQIAGDLTGETGANLLNEFAAPYTVTIKPTGTARAITGSSAGALITINAADRVIIDGSLSSTPNSVCPVVAATRDLTITNTNTGTSSAVIWLQSVGSNGATSNVIRNCNIVGSGNTATLTGIGSGNSTIATTSLGAGNNNNSYINNNISKTQYGIFSQGAGTGSKNTGTVINQNLVNTASPNNVRRAGILVGFENNITISGNYIDGIASATSSEDVFGISLGSNGISTTTFTGNEVTNATVTKNNIGSVRQTNTYSACGIFVAPATSGTNLIANNMISGVSANGTSADFDAGILIGGGAGSTTNIYYNTVYMQGTQTGGSDKSYALAIGGSNPTVDVRNNILVNTQNNGTGLNYAMGLGYSTFTALTSDRNVLYTTTGALYAVGATGSLSAPTNAVTFANFQSATGKDANSKNILPVFISSTDLRVNNTDPVNINNLDGTGTPVSVTDDIECNTRNVSTPDIGADEFTAPSCTGAVAGTATGSATFCGSGTPTITASGYSSGISTSYQWYSSANAGDYPNAGTAVSGQTNPAVLVTGTVSSTTYYWLRVTCTAASATDNSNMLTVTVNPLPAAVSVGTAGTYCGSTTLTATNGNDGTMYFQGTVTGGTSTATPSSSQVITGSGTYYFRAQSALGCWSTEGSAAVVINALPPAPTVTPSGTATICVNTPQALTATAAAPTGILSQNFNSGLGSWTVSNGAGHTAGTEWLVKTPPYTYSTNITSWNGFDGSNFIVANSDLSGSSANLTVTRLVSPVFSTAGYSAVNISFKHYMRASGETFVGVEYTTNGGSTWTPVTSGTYTNTSTTGAANNPPTITNASLTLNAAAVGQSAVQIRFRYDASFDWYWGIDDIVISGTPVPYNYLWSASPSTGSGLPSGAGTASSANNSITATPTSSGTFTYSAQSVDATTGCQSAAVPTGTITVNPDYTLTASAGANGAISPSGATNVSCLGTGGQTYTITPDACYSIASLTVDGSPVALTTGTFATGGTYVFSNVTANHTINVTFALNTYTVSVSSGSNGSVTPATGAVNCGSNATYTITPDACYSIAAITVDGSPASLTTGSLSTGGTYVFNNVTADHSISATFVQNTYTITATSGSNGSISPAGATSVNCNGSQSYSITPNTCAVISDVLVDGLSVGAVTTYTFNNVTANHTISATFATAVNTFTGTGNWTDGSKWSCGSAPASGDAFTIDGSATLNTSFTVAGSMSIGNSGTLTVAPNNTLTVSGSANFNNRLVTFKSDATGYGSLGQVTGTISNAGNVTVERYIPNNGFRSWRLLSVPTFGTQTIKAAWQEGQSPLVVGTPGLGTLITGPGGGNGLDGAATSASLLRWNGTGWTGISSTNATLSTFKAYFMYIRGDRTKGITGLTTDANATTLRSNGSIYTGDQNFTVSANAFQLVGNLYPSAIDFTQLGGLSNDNGVTGVARTFYIWDSKKLNGTSLGVYQTFSATNGYDCLISGGSFTLGQPNTTIESGQGFLVQGGTGSGGTLTLKEAAKISGTNGNLGFRPSTTKRKINTRLYNSDNELVDANVVVFDAAYSETVAGEDALKFTNPGANLAIEKNGQTLAVEGTTPVKENDVIQYRMWNLQPGTYTLELAAVNMAAISEGLAATLEDSYLKTSTAINLESSTAAPFTVDGNAGSSDANRFRIVFSKAKPVIVPDTKQGYSIAPNPVENGVMNLVFHNQKAGKYTVRILNDNGQLIGITGISHAGGSGNHSVSVSSGLLKSVRVEVIAPNGIKSVQTALIK